nr:hypothetical protein [Tanacetum cinerariifolium]
MIPFFLMSHLILILRITPLNLRPPPKPPDDNFDLEPEVISAVMEDIDEPDEHFNPGGEIFVSTNIKDVDYFPFMFVIRIFLPYLILPGISPLFLFAESEDTIFDPDYINRMEMLFTINPRPHNPTNDNMNVESFSSLPIPIQESDPRQEEIDVVSVINDVLPPSVDNDDSDEEVDAVGDLRVDNFIQNSEHEYSESENSDFDNPLLPLPPPEPPDKEFDFEINFKKEISVVRNVIVKFECINARLKFDVFNDENDVLSYFMFVIFDKEFSLLSVESEDTIFNPGISD